MPEGDTIFRAAATLRKALLNKTLLRFETSCPQAANRDTQEPLAGRIIQAIEPRGKHLLMVFRLPDQRCLPDATQKFIETSSALNLSLFPTDRVLHTHMRMNGSWHIYRPGEAWRKPVRQVVVTLYTADFVVPCFSAPVVELLTAGELARHPGLNSLGPDAMTPEFDEAEALRRIRRRPELEIGVALLDQKAIAGVGNVYKSEVLFIRRVSPFLRVAQLEDGVLSGLIEESHRLMRLNTDRGNRRTVFGLNERSRLWVYGRSGEPCRVCGETIRMKRQGLDARSTYYCSRCQGVG